MITRTGGDRLVFDSFECAIHALAPRCSHCACRIIGLIEDGRIDTRPWITHRCGFDAVATNFPSYTKPETGVIKAMVELE